MSRTAPSGVTPGALFTTREIHQQPEVWREAARGLELRRAELDSFLSPLLAQPDLRIVLTGAGTSAFVGGVAAPALSRMLGRRIEAVATTDIVSNPREYFAEDVPTLLVSFARSGNSPESIAATALADQVLSHVRHLVLTCNERGELGVRHSGRPESFVIFMPTRANDEAFAMTSSFTSMLLTCLLALGGKNDAVVQSLAMSASRTLDTGLAAVEELAGRGYERVVYLGSGPLAALARESALKLLELTAGAVVSYHDSALGFRHGPKSVLNDNTLVLVYVSSDEYTRQYDLDIIAELGQSLPSGNLVAISASPLPEVGDATVWVLDGLQGIDDAFLAIPFVVIAQQMGLSVSLARGMTPDNPFPSGVVNRVVEGVSIHSL